MLRKILNLKMGHLRRLSWCLIIRILLLFGFITAPIIRKLWLGGLSTEYRNKSVYLTGAAPSAQAPITDYDKYIAISSASKLLTDTFGQHCDLSVMDRSFFSIDHSQNCPSKSNMHSEGHYAQQVKNLLVVTSNPFEADVPYASLISFDNLICIPKWVRAFIVNYSSRANFLDNINFNGFTQVGTGIWTLSLLVFLRVRSVHLTGINFRTGTDSQITRYFYGTPSRITVTDYQQSRCRNHAAPDSVVISSLALIHRKKIVISTDECEIECLIFPNLS